MPMITTAATTINAMDVRTPKTNLSMKLTFIVTSLAAPVATIAIYAIVNTNPSILSVLYVFHTIRQTREIAVSIQRRSFRV
jgi:hypothetical protein